MDRNTFQMLMGSRKKAVEPRPITGLIATAFGDPATINRAVGGPSLTNVNSVATVTTKPPASDRFFSASFDASNYLQTTLASNQRPPASFTISFWARLDTGASNTFQRIFSFSTSTGTGEISVENFASQSANTITVNTGSGQITFVPVGDIRDWFRVTLVRDAGVFSVYIGSTLQGSRADTTDYSDRSLFRLGARGDDGNLRGWPGLVHDFNYSLQALPPP
jgi:hypothetical protein